SRYGDVLTPEMVSQQDIDAEMAAIYEGYKIWTFEAYVLGSAMHMIKRRLVDRIVVVGLFECGPESVIEAFIENIAGKSGIPLLKLYLDDHSGEAGLDTRIEAFMDTSANTMPTASETQKFDFHIVHRKLEKPVLGFTAMGNLDLVVRSVFADCGVEMVKPVKLSRRSLEIGKELAPEYMCMPLSAMLGQMIEMMDAGANRFLMLGGKGKCRLGWYAQIQDILLRKTGREPDFYILDSPFPLITKWAEFYNTLRSVTCGVRLDRVVKSLWLGLEKLKLIDRAEQTCHRMRAYEAARGSCDRVFDKLIKRVADAGSFGAIRRLDAEFAEEISSIKTEETDPLKVVISGEIWTVLEPFANMDIDRMLGRLPNVRVRVFRPDSVTAWFEKHVLHMGAGKRYGKELENAARPYLSLPVGGHGLESVGQTVLAARNGADGVIQLMPFTCMPEIVAQNIISSISDELDIPVLTLIISDQTGEAGMMTRLDAFLDLLEERRIEKRAWDNELYRH
ncbi:MAG TPA: hypothetical protein PLZ84_00715, partial [Clostridia bacterium]|nr:hypothetical protein [Clostridia bacterium]